MTRPAHVAPPRLAGATLAEARRELRAWFAARGQDDDADYLLCHALARSRAWLYANGDLRLDAREEKKLNDVVKRRADGVPLAYLKGRCEFYSLDFEVCAAVLTPRPETESIVEEALFDLPPRARVLDLGTGCGNVVIAVARARKDVAATATDISGRALEVARRNARRHGLSGIRFVQSDWFRGLVRAHRFDLITSNPPYVRDDDPELEAAVAAHEPATALFAGEDGLAHLRTITANAGAYLKPGGRLIVEHAPAQGADVRAMMEAAGLCAVRGVRDYGGRMRVAIGCSQARRSNNPAPSAKPITNRKYTASQAGCTFVTTSAVRTTTATSNNTSNQAVVLPKTSCVR